MFFSFLADWLKPQLPTDVGVDRTQRRVDEQVVFGLCDEGRPALLEARPGRLEATFSGVVGVAGAAVGCAAAGQPSALFSRIFLG